ncbi:hypothetical protein CCMA1212_003438 [Trichoderma ghanense]|uniref:Uncharacterized protein n=1 Tax=Trichoderma ghanense TaxID=65468 RepID=A0ABY2H7Y5_9HYPO
MSGLCPNPDGGDEQEGAGGRSSLVRRVHALRRAATGDCVVWNDQRGLPFAAGLRPGPSSLCTGGGS